MEGGDSRLRALQKDVLAFQHGRGPWLRVFLEELRQVLGARNAIAYRPAVRDDGWDLEFVEWVGAGADGQKSAHAKYVRSFAPETPGFAAYDPFVVQREQRNVALSVSRLFAVERSAPSRHARLHAALGTQGADQVRLLVCDGPRLLAWVGAVREEPFGDRDMAALESLAEPLRQRFLVESRVPSAQVHRAALEALLDAVGEAALLFHTSGRVELANEAGRMWLDQAQATGALRPLRAALRAKSTRLAPFTLIGLEERGCPEYVLALSTARRASLAEAVGRASRTWRLTSRETSVLELVASGKSNKEIAVALRCAEVTVEKCLTQIYRTSGSRSRTELAAKIHAP